MLDINAVRFEYVLPDKTKADYVLCDRNGRALGVIEAKKTALNPAEAEAQARGYAQQLKVPYIFLANGEEVRFWEWQREAFPRPVKTFFSGSSRKRVGDFMTTSALKPAWLLRFRGFDAARKLGTLRRWPRNASAHGA